MAYTHKDAGDDYLADNRDSKGNVCPRCMGRGLYRRSPFPDEKPCALCSGTGSLPMYCPACGNSEFEGHTKSCADPKVFE